MAKPPGQSDFHVESPNIDHEQDMAENGAAPGAVKVIYIVIIVFVIALVLLVGVGLHIPAGE